jgi:L-alanine-DL-glutamate epimerase-like enolase superfamily enzyme
VTALALEVEIAAREPGGVAAEGQRLVAEGVTAFRLALDGYRDLERLGALRYAVGPRARIVVDACGRDLRQMQPTLARFGARPAETRQPLQTDDR